MSSPDAPLRRRLGLADAVTIGLASMLGAGVFSVFAPAAGAAGGWLLAAVLLAGGVAMCNALSSAQLAARYPTSGGTYVYAREVLGAWPGFIAGWAFVIGKTASCAAMALTVAAYTVPDAWQRPVAALALAALTAVNLFGITRTAALARVLVVATLLVLAVVVAGGAAAPSVETGSAAALGGPYGVLQAAGLLFFAFAGYARVATLGEEVRAPRTTIPRAIIIALLVVLAVYLTVAAVAMHALGLEGLAASVAPLADVVSAAGWGWAVPIVGFGAAAAALGALLALIAGVSRTALAMGRNADLPVWLSGVHPRTGVPRRAEVAVAIAAIAIVLVADIRSAIGFSSFGVLLYYLLANLSAFRQPRVDRRYPRFVAIIGAVGCALLAATLPIGAVVAGLAVIAVGVVYRVIRLRRRIA